MTENSLEFIIEGDNAQRAATELAALVESFGAETTAEIVKPDEASDEARRAVDPVTLATLVLAIPPAVLAVIQIGDRIADRIEKRRRAKQLLERAHQMRETSKIEIHIVGQNDVQLLIALSADDLLDLADAKARDAARDP